MPILDFHTHRLDAEGALISVDPRQFDPLPGRCYSVGFHPWHDVDRLTAGDWALLERCAQHPQVLAIGETGMDTLRGCDLDIQADAFLRHLQLAHALGKPVIAHCVRTAQRLLDVRRHAGLTDVTLAIHVDSIYLSFGDRFNPVTLAATPLDRLLIETDDSPTPIGDVATAVAQTLQIPTQQLQNLVTANALRFLTP